MVHREHGTSGGIDEEHGVGTKEILSVGVEVEIARRVAPLPSRGFVIVFDTLLARRGHRVLATVGIPSSWGRRATKGEGGHLPLVGERDVIGGRCGCLAHDRGGARWSVTARGNWRPERC